MKRTIILSAILIGTMLVSTACGTSSKNTSVEQTSEDSKLQSIKIGVSNCSDTDTFTKEVANYLEKLISENHPEWNVDFVSAEMDSSIQLSQIETFIARNCDYIVMSASDSQANMACVDACNEAGIPLIDYVNNIDSESEKFVYVGGSNESCGKTMAEYVGDRLEDGSNVLVMEGAPGASNSEQRVRGFTDTLHSEYPSLNILESKTANWNQEDALTLMEDWLQAYSDINAVVCMNDNMAMGAAEAIKAAGRADENIMIIGADGLEVTMGYIRDGSIAMSMFYNFQKQAQNVYSVLEDMISSGESTHDDVFSDFEVIDSSNVNEYSEKYYSK